MLSTKAYAKALVDYAGKTENEVKDFLDGTNPGVDWEDTMFRTGQTQNYKLVFTKGTDGMQAYVSGNYMKNEGTLKAASTSVILQRQTSRLSSTSGLTLLLTSMLLVA